MRFNEMQYLPIDIVHWETLFYHHCEVFANATRLQEKIDSIAQINQLRNDFETMENLASIRHNIDTTDEYYDQEHGKFDTMSPRYQKAIDFYYQKLTSDSLRSDLEDYYGTHLFNLAAIKLKTFNNEILDDLELENQLASKYTKLRTQVTIDFEGGIYNIPQMGPFLQSIDRTRRQRAHEALERGLEASGDAFDQLYHELVQVRHRIAEKLGYSNFVDLAYARLMRTDYGPKDVGVFRTSVLQDLIPRVSSLYERQRKRLGIETLKYYDLSLDYLSGNPVPKGDSGWIIENGRNMYNALSGETGIFFEAMLQGQWMDLEAKPGKSGGGYCSYIPNYRAPFIFSNFNGTMGDIDVLTHEAGHAFQVFQSRDLKVPEYLWPTLEACEIHSMSMEFLTYPHMTSFFKEDTEKYFFSHMSSALLFIPYGVLVDDFQHWVYENPSVTIDVRRKKWRELEQLYLPHKDYDGNGYLESGAYWHRQGHIFSDPFYYIDYTLASVCAFQFWAQSQRDPVAALQEYTALCKRGGSLPFTSLVDSCKLKQPFSEGVLRTIISEIMTYLDGIDDTRF